MPNIRIDTSNLTYPNFVIPDVTGVVDGCDSILLSLEPGTYNFQQSGSFADFTFRVTSSGTIDYDTRNDAFLSGRGSATLIIRGFSITLDSTRLSHSILPTVFGADTLAPDRVHQLTLVPAVGYGFQPASGIVADFRFDLDASGEVVIAPRYGGFATASGQTLTISGYQVTIDTRALSHDLLLLVLGASVHFSPGSHDITLVPGAGYGFVSGSGVNADFTLTVEADGTVVVDPRFAGFAEASARTLTINGYRVSLDTRGLSRNLLPLLLGWTGGELSPGVHEFTAIPANGYLLQVHQDAIPVFRFSLDAAGRVTLTDAPAGVLVTSSQTQCGVPDGTPTGVQIQTFGSPGGRWSRRTLTWSVNPANCNLPPADVFNELNTAFNTWQALRPPSFTFMPVNTNGDIQASFGGSQLSSGFGSAGGVAASAPYPEHGRLYFDSNETWTRELLRSVALHEMGHALGLSHSNSPTSLMYPFDIGATEIDAETRDALRRLYGWQPQTPLTDRATSDRPSMAVATSMSFTFAISTLHMVWKGSGDDQRLFESRFENNAWTPQELIEGTFFSAQSPALAPFSITLPDGTPAPALIMAWRGAGDNRNLFYSTNAGTSWTTPKKLPDRASSYRPALATFSGATRMAWRGSLDDQGIYWSTLGSEGWGPQENIRERGTSHSPSLVLFQDKLYMFWKGIEGDSLVYYSWIDAANPIWRPQRIVAYPDTQTSGGVFRNIGSSHGPSATLDGDRILLAWKGAQEDQGIYFSLFDGDEFTGQIRVAGVGTSQGPAVCNISGVTHMAWKGVEGDNVIYWSTM
jgi:hypothetical protein